MMEDEEFDSIANVYIREDDDKKFTLDKTPNFLIIAAALLVILGILGFLVHKGIFFWILYCIGFILIWFENKFIVREYPLYRPLWFSPINQSKFWLFRIVMTYGGFVGIWYIYGYKTAGIAFGIYFLFSHIIFRIYYRREVIKLAKQYGASNINDKQLQETAIWMARNHVKRNMKHGGTQYG